MLQIGIHRGEYNGCGSTIGIPILVICRYLISIQLLVMSRRSGLPEMPCFSDDLLRMLAGKLCIRFNMVGDGQLHREIGRISLLRFISGMWFSKEPFYCF